MTTPKIIGTTADNAKFAVSFPNGLEGDPEIEIKNLIIDADGDSFIYASLLACSYWLSTHVDNLKARPQVVYNIKDINNKHVRLINDEIVQMSK